MSELVGQAAKRVLLPVALLLSVMVLLGVLVTRVFAHTWPLTVEDAVNRELAADRTASWNNVSLVFSTLASTQLIVLVTAIVAVVLRLVLHRWREPLFLCAAVTAQALVFLLTTMAIDRRRPAVEHMDVSPPTSSFPSGHTSAAVALYVGIAVLLALRARSTPAKVAWWALLVLVPVGVALTRMYRGMHHPSDVLASFLNGGTCVVIMARAVLDRGVRWGREKLPTVGRPARVPTA
ncbi:MULTISPECIES: phosphatase PAP2 family protein [unclassified Micromonospora]|uniref:phosphatase PAP2 family protein n=1 Tax=Micromonospora TaxID=1873 RepID=UPI00098D74F7|nr:MULTISPECIES: phosphatase PAP2 family protein [unclassified Micromonospora]MDI5937345.1 phosphatase PAP2 family protein [Micromonospora sp. DH15]OON30058.1 phosphoesterase PA-phosphatase [Micromonospora sp. Rc5]